MSESDLKPLEDMGVEIRNWILQRSQKAAAVVNTETDLRYNTQHFQSDGRLAADSSHDTIAAAVVTAAADLYDF